MAKDKRYNGHKNYNYWNVALWIGNDEGLYNMARDYVRRHPNKDQAALWIRADLQAAGVFKTPDGAPYTKSAIRAALAGL